MMFDEYPNQVLVIALADFEPQIGYSARLPGIAERAWKKLKAKHWSAGENNFTIRETRDLRFSFTATFRSVLAMTLGWQPWKEKGEDLLRVIDDAIETMDVEALKVAQIRTLFFAPLEMRHAEIVDLMFDSYLLPREKFENLPGKLFDATVQLYYELPEGQKLRMHVVPMTAVQAEQQFDQTPMLDRLSDSKFYDRGLDDFRERLKKDCLLVEVEVTSENTSRPMLARELRQAVNHAEAYTRRLIDRILSVKRSKGP